MTEPAPITDPSIPRIDPVPEGVDRPFWSVMIPTFNCAKYLRQTLESVLAQDPGPQQMQIEVLDDCSTKDDPEAVVREVGKGRVLFFRNPTNLGPTKNFNNCLRRSTGKYVHILHGDDYVNSLFYSTIKEMILQEPGIGLFGTRAFIIDDDGIINSISGKFSSLYITTANIPDLFKMNDINPLYFPTIVINRKITESLGGFDERFGHVADWEMWMRIMSHHNGILCNLPLACYRVFSQNDTSRHRRTGNNIHEMFLAFIRFKKYVNNLDEENFLIRLEEISFSQYRAFLDVNDHEAAASNYAIWMAIFPFARRLRRHIKEKIRSFLKILRTFKV